MFKRRARTTPGVMPTWNGRDDCAIQYLNDLEKFLREGQVSVWLENGMTAEQLARLAPVNDAQLAARFDQWRDEARARLKLGAS